MRRTCQQTWKEWRERSCSALLPVTESTSMIRLMSRSTIAESYFSRCAPLLCILCCFYKFASYSDGLGEETGESKAQGKWIDDDHWWGGEEEKEERWKEKKEWVRLWIWLRFQPRWWLGLCSGYCNIVSKIFATNGCTQVFQPLYQPENGPTVLYLSVYQGNCPSFDPRNGVYWVKSTIKLHWCVQYSYQRPQLM